MRWSPSSGESILIEGHSSFLLAGRAEQSFPIFIEMDQAELVQGVEPDDLVVVSAPEGGSFEPALMLLELVRTYHIPLIILPRGHPGIRRLKLVVAVAPSVSTNCSIIRGTHPEQHLLCSSAELSGISLHGEKGDIIGENIPEGISVRQIYPLSKPL
jgi:hypothetical protein